ncbi:MAG: addiction module toxin, HicA family [bacterium]|nr:addiction module toxin, HicA family [bacterium]
MGDLPRPTGKEMVRFLHKQGFELVRISGSHHYLERQGVKTSVPVHGNQTLKIGTLRGILRDVQLSPSEFQKRWNR